MNHILTRHLSALTLHLLTTLPASGFLTRWQYGHLSRIDAEGRIAFLEFATAGVWVWFLTALAFAVVTILLVRPLHSWLGLIPGKNADDDTDDEDGEAGSGQLRTRAA